MRLLVNTSEAPQHKNVRTGAHCALRMETHAEERRAACLRAEARARTAVPTRQSYGATRPARPPATTARPPPPPPARLARRARCCTESGSRPAGPKTGRRSTPRCWRAAGSCTSRPRRGILRASHPTPHATVSADSKMAPCARASRTLVLHAPLELGDDQLPGEVVEEGLRVDGHLCAPCATRRVNGMPQRRLGVRTARARHSP